MIRLISVLCVLLLFNDTVAATDSYVSRVAEARNMDQLRSAESSMRSKEESLRACQFEGLLKLIPYHCFMHLDETPRDNEYKDNLVRECMAAAKNNPASFRAEKQKFLPLQCRNFAQEQHQIYMYKKNL